MRGFRESRSIDVGYKAELHRAIAVFAKRAVSHLRSKIRTSDANVDDRLDFLSSVTFPLATPDAVGKGRHLVENRVNLRNDIDTVHENLLRPRSAKRHVKNRTFFSDVDFLSAKHSVASLRHAPVGRQLQQQADRFLGNAILGIIQEQ